MSSSANSPDTLVVQTGVNPSLVDQAPDTITVELQGQVHEIPYQAGSSILESVLKAGIEPPFSCRAGQCSACKAKLKVGRVKLEIYDALDSSDLEGFHILTCQAVCWSSKVVVNYDD